MASMIWKCIDSPKRKKFKAVDFVNKIMATDFSDTRDVLLDFLSRGEKIIAAGYCNMLLLPAASGDEMEHLIPASSR